MQDIENALAHKRVFIVLDDVDTLDQLDALLGNTCLHPGSKIIITTKDASLTERCALFKSQVHSNHREVLLNGLYESESLELLCIHAFNSQTPKEGYKEVSEKVVKYCDGHPLALQVLGRDVAETILNACDINTRSGITNLTDRCLLSIRWNKLIMHQLVQEMGRDLVRQESPDKPWERSRLWCHNESFEVLKQKKTKGVDWIKLKRQTVAWITEDSCSEFL
ncbi:hypothetical protein L1987_83726 [Smallanthus sonchifolius]|uniref:Uncharacterized protein n=1 Tax=Smallanthus sonchifolius TaxID=185202 RepID=A0ACB8YDV5_9ASTR|nr:hypothetical protein L1987_83726 [Smallanthus sonchifolius]